LKNKIKLRRDGQPHQLVKLASSLSRVTWLFTGGRSCLWQCSQKVLHLFIELQGEMEATIDVIDSRQTLAKICGWLIPRDADLQVNI
jgi:hypothetical protein